MLGRTGPTEWLVETRWPWRFSRRRQGAEGYMARRQPHNGLKKELSKRSENQVQKS